MDKTDKYLIVGAAALIVMGLVVAASAAQQAATGALNNPPCGGMRDGPGPGGNDTFVKDLGLPENATREQVSEALWQKQLKDLGLTEDSTLKEYRQALESRREAMQTERDTKLKERLGLSSDATDQEVMDALRKWQEDNKDLLGGPGGMPMQGHGPEGMFGAMGPGPQGQPPAAH